MIDADGFLALFPEFNSSEETIIAATITTAIIESEGYQGLPADKQAYAIALHVAAILMWQSESAGNSGAIESVASRNDRISYAVVAIEPFSLNSNHYGRRLLRLIATNYWFD